MKMNRIGAIVLSIVVITLPSYARITAKEIIANVKQSYGKQLKRIKDITITSDKGNVYQKRVKIDGKLVYKIHSELKDIDLGWGEDFVSGDVSFDIDDLREKIVQAKDIRYLGTEEIDKQKTYVLGTSNIAKLIGASEDAFPASGKVWIDADNWVVLKAEISSSQENEKEMKMVIKLRDYHSIQDVLIPYKLGIYVEMDLSSLSTDQKESMKEILSMHVEINIKEVKINTGIPDELFNPTESDSTETHH
ncbi:outer membrane lipoprotein-sorting protein [candidate division WOR-3 bacterium]|nr:outer membrane lipoprotein-sorting protein [candidate division WOR-3 bacterium]